MSSQRTAEIRAVAVRVALTFGLPGQQVAGDLGTGALTWNKGIEKERCALGKPARQSELAREIASLRKGNRLAREARASPKKATVVMVERNQ